MGNRLPTRVPGDDSQPSRDSLDFAEVRKYQLVGRSAAQVTIVDVAAHAGVHVSTASRALTGARRVHPHLVERVKSAAEALGYTPNQAARNLRLSRTMTLGAVFDRFEDPIFLDLLEGMGSACQEHNYSLAITTARGDPQVYRTQLQRQFERRVDGLFVVAPPDLGDSLASFLDAGIPALAVFWRGPGSDRLPIVRVNHEAAIAAAIAQLAEYRHRSVLFLTRSGPPRDVRSLLIERAAAAHHMRAATQAIPFTSPRTTYAECLGEYFRQADPPTALLTDGSALAPVIEALRSLGLAVPEDISVVTFDESQWNRRLGLPWSTIGFDMRDIGLSAGRVMAEWLNGNPPPDSVQAATYEWIQRGSVG